MTRAPPEQCQPQEFVREPSAYPTWSPSLNARSAPPRPSSLAPRPATSPSTYPPAWSSPAHRAPLRIPPPTAVPGRQEIRRSTPKQTNRRPPRDRNLQVFAILHLIELPFVIADRAPIVHRDRLGLA